VRFHSPAADWSSGARAKSSTFTHRGFSTSARVKPHAVISRERLQHRRDHAE
jgi:hypothetical protein